MTYLKLTPYESALERIEKEIVPIASIEEVSIIDANGRILAENIFSPLDIPSFPKSQMDGYAVISSDTFKASECSHVFLDIVEHVNAGDVPLNPLTNGKCAYVATGAPIPKNADSVIMLEDVLQNDNLIELIKSIAPGENLMQPGYDFKKNELVLRKGMRLTSRHIGSLSGMGIPSVRVFKRPLIGILSTGSEIIAPGSENSYGKTYDVNGSFLYTEVKRIGCDVRFLGITPDNIEELKTKLSEAKNCDVLLISAGVSKGAKDMISKVLSENGSILLHGVNIKPGKPTLAAKLDNTLVIGLPGHPTSCVMIFKLLAEPLIFKLMGMDFSFRIDLFKLNKRIFATKGRKQFLPVIFENGGITPVFKGSGAISSFLKAEGIAIIDEMAEYLDEGDILKVILLED